MSLLVPIHPLQYPSEAHDKNVPLHVRQELKARCREEYTTYREQCLASHYNIAAELAKEEEDGE